MNIIIAGCTCSGKTTLANRLDGCVMPQDNYFKDLDDIPKYKGRYLMDSINAFHYSEYREDAMNLINNGTVEIPQYDISANKRLKKELLILKRGLIIFEGLHAIRLLSDIQALKIFLYPDLDECLRRRVERDKEVTSPDVITEYFNECVIPMYKEYIEPQKDLADIVIKEGDDASWVLKKYMKS